MSTRRRTLAEMATPNVVKLDPPLEWQIAPEQWLFQVWIGEEGRDPEPFNVVITDTDAKAAGFGGAPTAEWLREQFLGQAEPLLTNDRSIIDQMMKWEMPFVLRAD